MMSGTSIFSPVWDDASPEFEVTDIDGNTWEQLSVREARKIIEAQSVASVVQVSWYDPNCERWVGLPCEYGHRFIPQAE